MAEASNKSKSWPEENLNEMDQSVHQILKLVEEDDYYLASEKRSQLISLVREFHRMYQSLVENCNRLTEQLSKTPPSENSHSKSLVDFELSRSLKTPFFTPNQKLRSNISGHPNANVEISFNSDGGGFVVSQKEATELSSSLSSEADATNSAFNCDHDPPVDHNNGFVLVNDEMKSGFAGIKQHQIADVDKTKIMSESNEEKYEEFLKISIDNEELRNMKLKLELSENEVARLISELEKCESFVQHAKNLENQLECVKKDLEMKETALEQEIEKVAELKKQTAQLETHVPDCYDKIEKLTEELQEARESPKMSKEKIRKLHREVDMGRNEISYLREQLTFYEARLSELINEGKTLKVTESDKQEKSSSDQRKQLQSENLTSPEEVILLKSRIKDLESRSKELEKKLVQCEREKLEREELITSQEVLRDEMKYLREELQKRIYQIEGMNKEFERHRDKYDKLKVERDEKARIQKLLADVSSRDGKVLDLERQILQLHVEKEEIISASRITENTVTGLKSQVDKLQQDVACKRIEISDGAEAKREAIRQLCFSLEYYRTSYQELRQAVTRKKPHVVTS